MTIERLSELEPHLAVPGLPDGWPRDLVEQLRFLRETYGSKINEIIPALFDGTYSSLTGKPAPPDIPTIGTNPGNVAALDASGRFSPALLGSGTRSSETVLYGDGVYREAATLDKLVFSSNDGLTLPAGRGNGVEATVSDLSDYHLLKFLGRTTSGSLNTEIYAETSWMLLAAIGSTLNTSGHVEFLGSSTSATLAVWQTSSTTLQMFASTGNVDTLFAIIARKLDT